MDIYPSILETNLDDFKSTLKKLLPIFNHFQIDIADGILVPNRTIQIEEIMSVVSPDSIGVSSQWSVVSGKTFEFHLMVNDYQKEIKKLDTFARSRKSVPVNSILIHISVYKNDFPKVNGQLSNVNGYQVGLVLNPEDPVQPNLNTILQFSIVQLMTVHPGRQGSPFLPSELEKINQLRDAGYKGKIILDGGINDQTLPIILKNKFLPDAIAPGSYFAKVADPASNLAKLNSIISYNKSS